jgi:hypothetical protein
MVNRVQSERSELVPGRKCVHNVCREVDIVVSLKHIHIDYVPTLLRRSVLVRFVAP